jgi:hypothetical protein
MVQLHFNLRTEKTGRLHPSRGGGILSAYTFGGDPPSSVSRPTRAQ